MRSFYLLILTFTAFASAGPIPQTPVPAASAVPAAPADSARIHDPASRPMQFDFGGSSQYSQQELRRRQRQFLQQAGAFQKSPYGSGAVPVPENSAEKGFGGHTLF